MNADDKKNEQTGEPESVAADGTPNEEVTTSGSVPETEATEASGDKPEDAVEKAEDSTDAVPPPDAAEKVTVVQNTPARADGFARFVAVVALLLAVAVLALSQFPQVPKGSAAKLAAVEGKVAQIGELPAAAPSEDLGPAVDELRTQLASMEDRLANLSLLIDEMRTGQERLAAENQNAAGSGDDGLAERVAALSGQVEELKNRPEVAPTAVTVQPAAPAPSPQTAEMEGQLAALTTELSALKTELARLEERQSGISGAIGEGDANVRQELRAAIDAASGALTAQMNNVAASAAANTEATNSQVAGKAALVLAAGRLKDAASLSAPFNGAWQAIEALGVSAAEYKAISDTAPTGAPTLSDLQSRFSDAASRAIVADKVGDGGGWVDGALKRMGSLVKVRRTGELQGDEVEAIVARAEVRLSEDNLAGAVEELQSLPEAAAKEMTGWVGDAQRRLALDASIDALQASLLAGLAGSD